MPHSTLSTDPAERSPLPAEVAHGGSDSRDLPVRTIILGLIGSLLLLAGSIGGGATLIDDPILGSGPLSALRYGHGRDIATAVMYLGFGLLVWAWIRLGRGVLARLIDSRGVLLATATWVAPMLIAPPMFSRDVYSYLGQGLLALHGIDPYMSGPSTLTGPIPDNVHPTWQTTPAPYGPLFIALAKGVVLVAGNGMISSIIVLRLLMLIGLGLLVFALPGLVRHLGGRLPLALWLAAASPMTVVHLVGGPHNDLLVVGLLAYGALLMLEHRHAGGIALVTLAVAVKATAVFALPFLVWIWAGHLSGARWRRFVRALAPSLGIFTAVFGGSMMLAKVGFGWISALSAPGIIVNYLSAPTALGQVTHAIVGSFVYVDAELFIESSRALGTLVLLGILAWQWWLARDGGPEAIRRAAIVLFLSALLSPVVHPWYLTWGVALGCAVAWTPRALSFAVGFLVAVVLCYYPDGEQAMYNWPLVGFALGAAVIAGLSLIRFDPLSLSRFFRANDDPSITQPAVAQVSSGPSRSTDPTDPSTSAAGSVLSSGVWRPSNEP